MPASARTRKRAGSAPDRAGVIDAPKSPASVVRTAVMNFSSMSAAFALQVILSERVRITATNDAMVKAQRFQVMRWGDVSASLDHNSEPGEWGLWERGEWVPKRDGA